MPSPLSVCTTPETVTAKGLLLLSLVRNESEPTKVPSVTAVSETVKVVELPPGTEVSGCWVTTKPLGTPTVPRVSGSPPSLNTVKTRVTGLPSVVEPKLTEPPLFTTLPSMVTRAVAGPTGGFTVPSIVMVKGLTVELLRIEKSPENTPALVALRRTVKLPVPVGAMDAGIGVSSVKPAGRVGPLRSRGWPPVLVIVKTMSTGVLRSVVPKSTVLPAGTATMPRDSDNSGPTPVVARAGDGVGVRGSGGCPRPAAAASASAVWNAPIAVGVATVDVRKPGDGADLTGQPTLAAEGGCPGDVGLGSEARRCG